MTATLLSLATLLLLSPSAFAQDPGLPTSGQFGKVERLDKAIEIPFSCNEAEARGENKALFQQLKSYCEDKELPNFSGSTFKSKDKCYLSDKPCSDTLSEVAHLIKNNISLISIALSDGYQCNLNKFVGYNAKSFAKLSLKERRDFYIKVRCQIFGLATKKEPGATVVPEPVCFAHLDDPKTFVMPDLLEDAEGKFMSFNLGVRDLKKRADYLGLKVVEPASIAAPIKGAADFCGTGPAIQKNSERGQRGNTELKISYYNDQGSILAASLRGVYITAIQRATSDFLTEVACTGKIIVKSASCEALASDSKALIEKASLKTLSEANQARVCGSFNAAGPVDCTTIFNAGSLTSAVNNFSLAGCKMGLAKSMINSQFLPVLASCEIMARADEMFFNRFMERTLTSRENPAEKVSVPVAIREELSAECEEKAGTFTRGIQPTRGNLALGMVTGSAQVGLVSAIRTRKEKWQDVERVLRNCLYGINDRDRIFREDKLRSTGLNGLTPMLKNYLLTGTLKGQSTNLDVALCPRGKFFCDPIAAPPFVSEKIRPEKNQNWISNKISTNYQ